MFSDQRYTEFMELGQAKSMAQDRGLKSNLPNGNNVKEVKVDEVSDEDTTFKTVSGSKMKNKPSTGGGSFLNASFDYNPF